MDFLYGITCAIVKFQLVVWNILFFHMLGIIIPTDFHIFQRGRLNHQPELDQNWVSGMVLMGSCHGLDPVEATNGSSQWLEFSLAKM